jgi:hypothetical protein
MLRVRRAGLSGLLRQRVSAASLYYIYYQRIALTYGLITRNSRCDKEQAPGVEHCRGPAFAYGQADRRAVA